MSKEKEKKHQIFLFVDESPESREAEELLNSCGLSFQRIPSDGLGCRIGGHFIRGLRGARMLASSLAPEAYEVWFKERLKEKKS